MFASFAAHQFLGAFGILKRLSALTAVLFLTLPATTNAQTVSQNTTVNKGSYVCTPAGFGRKSRCYAR